MVWVTLLLFALGLAYLWVRKRYKYFEERAVPYLEPVFLLGNTYPCMTGKQRLGELFCSIYKKTEGHGIVGIFQMLTPVYLIRDPELVVRVLVTDSQHFESHGFAVDKEVNPLDGHLFHLEGDEWRSLRKRLTPAFSTGRLKWMFPQVESCAGDLQTLLMNKCRTQDGILDVRDLMARFSTDVIGSCAFGVEPGALREEESEFRDMGRMVLTGSLKQRLRFVLRVAWPSLYLALKLKSVNTRVEQFFFGLVRTTFQARLQTASSRNDFMQILLELRQTGEVLEQPVEQPSPQYTNPGLSDEVLAAQAFVFFIAGFESTSTAMSLTLDSLARRPDLQETVRKEIRSVIASHKGLSYESLAQMTLLEACLSETLRLFPPLEVLMRKCTKDYLLGDIYIPRGTTVMVPVSGIHRDPLYYPDPDEYNPQRFLDGNPPHGTYMPFGIGPRTCIAKRLALMEAKFCLASLIDGFQVSLVEGRSEPVQLGSVTFILQPKSPLWLKFTSLS